MSSLPKPLGQPWAFKIIVACGSRFERPRGGRYTKRDRLNPALTPTIQC